MIVFGKERDYVIHDEINIKGFFGDYRWLSNFEVCKIVYGGLEYPSSENAYQAAKTLNPEIKLELSMITPSKSKQVSKTLEVRSDWDEVKRQIMFDICLDKFTRNPELGTKLIETGDKYLEETNHWKDIYWGVCDGQGQNNLGKILMDIRNIIR
jgi:ribA/ribD-fused uncharacterized protein